MGSENRKVFIAFGLVAAFLCVVVIFFIRSLILQHRRYRRLEAEKWQSEFRAREKERFEIATELHNEISPLLVSIKLRLIALEDQGLSEINACTESLTGCIEQVRDISKKIAPLSVFNATFQQMLEPYINSLQQSQGLDIQFNELNDLPLSTEAHTHIYRILQEIISNTIKHAQASQLIIETSTDGQELLIRTSDDGIGFDIRQFRSNPVKSIGLYSMETRVSMLNGVMKFSERRKGTQINIRIPWSSLRDDG